MTTKTNTFQKEKKQTTLFAKIAENKIQESSELNKGSINLPALIIAVLVSFGILSAISFGMHDPIQLPIPSQNASK